MKTFAYESRFRNILRFILRIFKYFTSFKIYCNWTNFDLGWAQFNLNEPCYEIFHMFLFYFHFRATDRKFRFPTECVIVHELIRNIVTNMVVMYLNVFCSLTISLWIPNNHTCDKLIFLWTNRFTVEFRVKVYCE